MRRRLKAPEPDVLAVYEDRDAALARLTALRREALRRKEFHGVHIYERSIRCLLGMECGCFSDSERAKAAAG